MGAATRSTVRRIALVTMPFVSVRRPSIQLGLLKSLAESVGWRADTFHLNIDFATRVGATTYEALCEHRGHLIGDWLFSLCAFGDVAPDPQGRFLEVIGERLPTLLPELEEPVMALASLRGECVPEYVDSCADTVPWLDYDVVGFTSTFQQNAASFALARRIKARHPQIIMLFGGSNFESAMGVELARSVAVVDLAVIGEAEEAFPALLNALARGEALTGIPGLVGRGVEQPVPSRPVMNLDATPLPDYAEYFARLERSGLFEDGAQRDLDLPFEASRGCWWGDKQHCVFCGLNGQGMQYRSKTPERVRWEIGELTRRYQSFRLQAVDNILDPGYLRTLLPALAAAETDYQLFFEVKSNLTRAQIKVLRQGGVRRIQPGIESLSSRVLGLMRKGVSAAQNVNVLRWAQHYGISVGWNLLWGFPGERADDYTEQASLLRKLVHLEPPGGCGRIWMERFSPIFTERDRYPVVFMRPEQSYRHIYPDSVDQAKIAYFFDYEFADRLDDSVYASIAEAVQHWQRAWSGGQRPTLTCFAGEDFAQIEDKREPEKGGFFTLEGPLARLYLACSERAQTVASAMATARIGEDAEQVEQLLNDYCESGVMMRDGDRYLSLALSASRVR
jgi:ribosomal peptide maturation radical SAM protein 1